MLKAKVFAVLAFVVGMIFWLVATFFDFDAHRNADVQQTISLAGTRIFAGLCLVAAAILYAAAIKAQPGQAVDAPAAKRSEA